MVAWAGTGTGLIVHTVPFHTSDSGAKGWVAAPRRPWKLPLIPTATQAPPDVQDTPFRKLSLGPRGLGIFSMRHALPFHDSASVSSGPVLLMKLPTATQALAAAQDTAVR